MAEKRMRLSRKGSSLMNPIDLIAGVMVILGGISVIVGYANLGSLLSGIGLMIEIIKVLVREGLK